MGLPIKHRKKYISHKQRWDKKTIEDEAVLVNDYSLKNKKEIRKVEFLIAKFKKIAKELNKTDESKKSEQAVHFLESLKTKGFLAQEADSLDQILDMSLRDVLERRLSNVVYKNKLAKTPKQARQFIVHRHVTVGGKVIDSPSYSVSLKEEVLVGFIGTSSLASEEHPERRLSEEGVEEEVKEMKDLTPKEEKSNFDEKEKILDEEEADEVQE